MNITVKFIFLLLSIQCYSQRISNSNLKFYNTVIFDKLNGWKAVGKIKDGKIISESSYLKDEFRGKWTFLENKITNENIEIFCSPENSCDTTDYVVEQIIDTNIRKRIYKSGSVEIYSNFNQENLPELIEQIGSDSLFNFRKEIKYDYKGNIVFEKAYHKIDGQIQFEVDEYKYDDLNNVIEINRSSFPKQEYPIIITGGRPLYENEKFEYKYNDKQLWTEQYWIVDGKKRIIEKRIFK